MWDLTIHPPKGVQRSRWHIDPDSDSDTICNSSGHPLARYCPLWRIRPHGFAFDDRDDSRSAASHTHSSKHVMLGRGIHTFIRHASSLFQPMWDLTVSLGRLLLPMRVSHRLPPPDAILPYLRKVGFGDAVPLRNFVFDNSIITAFVERWRPKTHTFLMSWSKCTITLQDVAYHLGMRVNGEPVGSCFRDFQTWYHTGAWELVECLLGAKPLAVVQQGAQRREAFSLKLTWLQKQVRQMPLVTTDPDTLR
ncbi:uncharacterized protein DS421_1g06350 [Arachis hypogaea]|nr:uncharacterized protein DS421_1g06350 [Arachis hypogaea]